MARAHKIYIVLTGDPRDWPVMAACTVKHECVTWLKTNAAKGEINLEDVYVLTSPDGENAPNHAADGLPTGKEFIDAN